VDPGHQSFLASLERGSPALEILDQIGEPEPAKAAASFLRASGHADLGPERELWVPQLLAAARPGFGAQCLDELATRYRQLRGEALSVRRHPTLPLVLGSSDFLARLLLRHPNWVDELAGDLPAAPEARPVEPDWTSIRIAKYKGLLRIAARDLAQRPLADGLGELSRLADACLVAGLASAQRDTGASELPALLALGKLGGDELNFSSDVDLMFLHEPRPGTCELDALEQHRELARLIQTLVRHFEAASEDGFAYRVDLDLRPEGRQGVLVNSVEAALTYYETFGADWERQMLIRLRPVAGPAAAAQSFVRGVAPFIWRRTIDPGAVRAVRTMKLRIEQERRSAGRDIEADLKEGPGGIRDIEFLVQALQLFHGGREPRVRTGNVLTGLEALGATGLLPHHVVSTLSEAYLWLRRAEHALQLVEERQVHTFPRDRAAQRALARRMGYRALEGEAARNRLLDDWTNVRSGVRQEFDALVLGTDGG
jgi:[glutamine synthetase] adenylyltransferase / [glutamine synthetase]-adenylyl-L-tyrosine phosphorylase